MQIYGGGRLSWKHGMASMSSQEAEAPIEFASDASGSWGCGAWWGREWFQFQWPEEARVHHISFLELLAVMLACTTWGRKWQGRMVLCWCDNQAAVQAISARSCRDSGQMHLLRCLFFLEAIYQFRLSACHRPGVDNTLADSLSRDNLLLFHSKVPKANRDPTPPPSQLAQLLLNKKADWTSPTWIQSFSSSAQKA